MTKRLLFAALLTITAGPAVHAETKCTVKKLADLPVTMSGMRPMVHAAIEGHDVTLEADSGAYFSMISPGSAAELNLHKEALPPWYVVTGVGGTLRPYVAQVKTFTIAGATIPKVDFLVGGSEVGSVGLLGQNVLALADTEFDLAHGMIRLMRSQGCSRTLLAYWAKADQAYSMLETDAYDREHPHIIASILINGVKIRALLDTGAGTSFMTLKAAAKIGLKPGGAGVVAAGVSGGLGRGLVSTWIGPVSSVKLGEEEIKNTRIRFGGDMDDVDMLLGADFFLSHRVYWAKDARRVFFTFNGGHVFDLKYLSADDSDEIAAAAPAPVRIAEEGPEPKTADEYIRRGQVRVARGDARGGVSDLDHALALEPRNVEYLRQRALLHIRMRQSEKALADVDRLLKIKADDFEALMMRAGLRRAKDHDADVRADIDAAAAAAPRSSDSRMELAGFYEALELYPQAIAQYGLWIPAHPDDNKRPIALNGRCWARAMAGIELDLALKDCNAALSARPHSASFLDSRGMVRVRMGDFAKAIVDYDEALKLQPDIAWSLYGRGIAKLRLGQKEMGEVDLAKARKLDPDLPAEAKKRGIAP